MFYFAYGSNMSLRRLVARIGPVSLVGTGCLAGYSLRFHKRGRDGSGKCDAYFTGKGEDKVFGVVFEISKAQCVKLDRYESRGSGYELCRIEIETYGSQNLLNGWAYFATDIDERLKPFTWYKTHVIKGALEHHLPYWYVSKIIRTKAIQDPDRQKHIKELSIYSKMKSIPVR